MQRRLEVGQQCEEVMNEAEETMKKLMAPRELMFTEALIPMCYHHWEGTWDVCAEGIDVYGGVDSDVLSSLGRDVGCL